MSALQRMLDAVRRRPEAQRLGESDAPADLGEARRRDTGGSDEAPGMDRNSTTGATPNAVFVGRAGSDETGDVGTSGAEARGDDPIEEQGAARDA